MTRSSEKTAGLAHEAYLKVRSRILRGEFAIGQAISRRKVAEELGMSFLPVSEALLRLEIEGLIESRARAGTRVRIPTRQAVRGHYTVREALEVQAARLFAAAATAAERAELLKLAAKVDQLAERPDQNRLAYLTAHEKLHRRVAECARCPALSDAIEKTHALASTWLCAGHAPADQASSSRAVKPRRQPARRHSELAQVLVEKDAEAAAEAMRAHVVFSMQNTMQRLAPYFRLRSASRKTYSRTVAGRSRAAATA